jgi:lysophospholipase L1-like esterase
MKYRLNKIPAIIVLAILLIPAQVLPASSDGLKKHGKDKQEIIRILTLGDSNGALPFGWPNQLRDIRPNDTIFNISISGNTIGFVNNGRRSLNTLANIRDYMEKAFTGLGTIDRVVIMLGTNDCKSVFSDSLSLVPGNMKKLLSEITLISKRHRNSPVIYVVSPPPFGPDEMLDDKYKGGMERVACLNDMLEDVADESDAIFINTCDILSPVFSHLTPDGVHLNAEGQRMIALIINENLKY